MRHMNVAYTDFLYAPLREILWYLLQVINSQLFSQLSTI
jgi:hypothetical protein